jgi:hypothetical protein
MRGKNGRFVFLCTWNNDQNMRQFHRTPTGLTGDVDFCSNEKTENTRVSFSLG